MNKDTLYVKRKRPTDMLLLEPFMSLPHWRWHFYWELSCMSS